MILAAKERPFRNHCSNIWPRVNFSIENHSLISVFSKSQLEYPEVYQILHLAVAVDIPSSIPYQTLFIDIFKKKHHKLQSSNQNINMSRVTDKHCVKSVQIRYKNISSAFGHFSHSEELPDIGISKEKTD